MMSEGGRGTKVSGSLNVFKKTQMPHWDFAQCICIDKGGNVAFAVKYFLIIFKPT